MNKPYPKLFLWSLLISPLISIGVESLDQKNMDLTTEQRALVGCPTGSAQFCNVCVAGTVTALGDTCETSRTQRNNLIVEVQQSFYGFQDATSNLKRSGHDPDPAVIQAALANFMSYIDPNFILYQFITYGQTFTFPTLASISEAYYGFATVTFNSYSEHFSTNVVVTPVPGTNCLQAHMTAGGGEWASLNNTVNPAYPNEQTTLSNWDIIWRYLPAGPRGAGWYVYSYTEYGNRLFRFCPPTGPLTLLYARQFPGDIPEATVDYACT